VTLYCNAKLAFMLNMDTIYRIW